MPAPFSPLVFHVIGLENNTVITTSEHNEKKRKKNNEIKKQKKYNTYCHECRAERGHFRQSRAQTVTPHINFAVNVLYYIAFCIMLFFGITQFAASERGS